MVMHWPAKLRLSVKRYEGSTPSLSAVCLMMNEFDNEEIRYQSIFITNILVLWQNGFMRRSEIPEIEVQFLGAPQKMNSK